MEEAPLTIEYWPLGKLQRHPRNPKSHKLEEIQQSMQRFGYTSPIMLDERSGMVCAGHGRIETLAAMSTRDPAHPPTNVRRSLDNDGEWLVPVIRGLSFQSEAELEAYLVADNRLTEIGGWDDQKLLTILKEQEEAGLLQGTGFDLEEFRYRLSLSIKPGDLTGEDSIAYPAEFRTKLGDLYLLGDHRLLCGDSTNMNNVERVMNGQQAVLISTDPPYLVDYQGGSHPRTRSNALQLKDKDWSSAYREIEIKDAEGFVKAAVKAAVKADAAWYIWHASARQALIEQCLLDSDILVHQQIIWKKTRTVLTHSHFMWNHEPCFYGWKKGHQPKRRPPANATTVWEISSAIEDGLDSKHPTQKPVELFRRPMEWHSLAGDVVYEPFAGSGTSFIAAEQLQRRCYGLEISPQFCDVIIARWEKFTGKKAQRVEAHGA